jgi:NADPH-dependent F420 reductase
LTQDREKQTHVEATGLSSKGSKRLAVLGGTGRLGGGLALRWSKAGYEVFIGSRQAEKAARVAAELNRELDAERIRGLANAEAATRADISVLTVPYQAHRTTLSGLRAELQSKILVDVTVPLSPPQVTRVHIPEEGPAAVQAQSILGEGVRVVAALQNVSEHVLRDVERDLDSDVLVCADDDEAKAEVMDLVLKLGSGIRALDAGPLTNAVVPESLTPIIIGLSKQFRRLRVGIRFTGIDTPIDR